MPSVDRERWPYRMRDLCEATGLDRQTIHFYIAKRLIPEGHKTGRNMAYYGEQHLERLRLVLELKTERFLPLDTIRAILDGDDRDFTPEQRGVLTAIKDRVADVLGSREHGDPRTVPVATLIERHGVEATELAELDALGLLATIEVEGAPHVPVDDVWVVELWADLRAAGFTRERGFEVGDLRIYVDAVATLFERERLALGPRLAALPADQAAELARLGLPLIDGLLGRLHRARARKCAEPRD